MRLSFLTYCTLLGTLVIEETSGAAAAAVNARRRIEREERERRESAEKEAARIAAANSPEARARAQRHREAVEAAAAEQRRQDRAEAVAAAIERQRRIKEAEAYEARLAVQRAAKEAERIRLADEQWAVELASVFPKPVGSVKLDLDQLRISLEEDDGQWLPWGRTSLSRDQVDATLAFLEGLDEGQRDQLARFDPGYELLSYSIDRAEFHMYVAIVLGTPLDQFRLMEGERDGGLAWMVVTKSLFETRIDACLRERLGTCEPLKTALALSDLAQAFFVQYVLGSNDLLPEKKKVVGKILIHPPGPRRWHYQHARLETLGRLSISSMLLELEEVDRRLEPLIMEEESTEMRACRRLGLLLVNPPDDLLDWELEQIARRNAPRAPPPVDYEPISVDDVVISDTFGGDSTAASDLRSLDSVLSAHSPVEAAGLQDQMIPYAHDCMGGNRHSCAVLSSTIRQSTLAMAVFLKRVVGGMNRTVGKALLRSLIDSRWIFTRSLLTKRKHARLLSMPLGEIQGGLPAWSGEQSIKEVLRSSLHSLPKRYPPTEGRVPE